MATKTPDNNIQQIAISQLELPVVASDGNYYLRYRIVSEDKSNTSTWSQTYAVKPKTLWQILGISANPQYSYSSDGSNLGISWTIPKALVDNSFDIFVKYDSDTTWTYLATTTSNNYYWSSPYTTSSSVNHTVNIRVQIQTNPPTATDASVNIPLFIETGAKSIRPTALGGGTPSSTSV